MPSLSDFYHEASSVLGIHIVDRHDWAARVNYNRLKFFSLSPSKIRRQRVEN